MCCQVRWSGVGEKCEFIWHFWDFIWSFMSTFYCDVGKKKVLSDFLVLFIYNTTNFTCLTSPLALKSSPASQVWYTPGPLLVHPTSIPHHEIQDQTIQGVQHLS